MASASPAISSPPRVDRGIPIAARRHPFVARVAGNLRRRCGAGRDGESIVVGLSGGPDSAALLAALVVLRDRARTASRLELSALHVHHHLRGASADADAEFATALAADLDVPVGVHNIAPGSLRTGPGNTADAARNERYTALRRAAAAAGARYVAVGHHADDQLETMLIALGRGAGLAGIAGMPWQRPLGGGVTLIRPQLDRRRVECEAFCRAAQTGWRDDPSNTDRTNLRARVRQDLLPAIESMWPGAASRAAGTADAVATARAALDASVDAAFGAPSVRSWPRSVLAALPPLLIAAGLRRAALDADAAIADALGQRLLLPVADAVADETTRPRTFTWPRGLHLSITAHEVRLRPLDRRC